MKWSQVLVLYVFWPALVLVVWGELDPNPPGIEHEIWDKALHFIAYFGLGGMISVALKADRRVVAATLGLIVLGGILEILQGFTGRDPSLADEAANMVGAISGAGAGWLLIRLMRPKILPSPGQD